MKLLLQKEMKLTALSLTYFFIAFGLMAFLVGYPILLAAFFVCLGIFQTFQTARESNDILYTAMLPVAKKNVVSAKYLFSLVIELCAFALMTIATLIRRIFLSEASLYLSNALMNANLAFLGYALLVFAAFNIVFVGGFFKTAYGVGKPFLLFGVVCLLLIGAAETIHFLPVPVLSSLNTTGFSPLFPQLVVLIVGIVFFAVGTWCSLLVSQKRFEAIDLL